jgi:hypothetical protein
MKWLNRKSKGTSKYRSQFEAKLVHQLETAGVKFGYESKTIGYVKVCKYKPDFLLHTKKPFLLEAKGYFLPSDRTKLLAVLKQNPGIDLRIVFQRAGQKLSKRSSTSYGDWATAHGIKWAEKTIPEEWIKNDSDKGRDTKPSDS